MHVARSIAEAETFFLLNVTDDLRCVRGDGTEQVVECYPDAVKFFAPGTEMKRTLLFKHIVVLIEGEGVEAHIVQDGQDDPVTNLLTVRLHGVTPAHIIAVDGNGFITTRTLGEPSADDSTKAAAVATSWSKLALVLAQIEGLVSVRQNLAKDCISCGRPNSAHYVDGKLMGCRAAEKPDRQVSDSVATSV